MKLPKKYCKELAETIPNNDLFEMLKKAKENVKDWSVPSRANLGISRGSNWNMFCKDFDVNKDYRPILKYRILEEFGEFISEKYKPSKKSKINNIKTTHFKPDFKNFK